MPERKVLVPAHHLYMRLLMGYPLLNSSGTTRFINGNLYWFVLRVGSLHKIFCACFSNISNCSFVGNPNSDMLFFKSISSHIFGPNSVFPLRLTDATFSPSKMWKCYIWMQASLVIYFPFHIIYSVFKSYWVFVGHKIC